jgi:hypothetical protein
MGKLPVERKLGSHFLGRWSSGHTYLEEGVRGERVNGILPRARELGNTSQGEGIRETLPGRGS